MTYLNRTNTKIREQNLQNEPIQSFGCFKSIHTMCQMSFCLALSFFVVFLSRIFVCFFLLSCTNSFFFLFENLCKYRNNYIYFIFIIFPESIFYIFHYFFKSVKKTKLHFYIYQFRYTSLAFSRFLST